MKHLQRQSPFAASEQDARTACTVEKLSSSRILCVSSKPSSLWKNQTSMWAADRLNVSENVLSPTICWKVHYNFILVYHKLLNFAVEKVIFGFLTVFIQFQDLLHGLLCFTVALWRTGYSLTRYSTCFLATPWLLCPAPTFKPIRALPLRK